ncbi:hypothetical protein J11TS1_29110 [Oceanobacillus sp. J11TS1]|nr:hypothetical protein J11TS1_29110 [Oceanobacillus sp. J11TS1]
MIIFIVILWNRRAMGAGDMKLMGVLGVVLGPSHIILTFLLACMTGALIGGVLLLPGIVQRNKPFPFGPFIALGALLAYFWGDIIIEWYLSLFI